MSVVTEEHRAKAEIYNGGKLCQQKSEGNRAAQWPYEPERHGRIWSCGLSRRKAQSTNLLVSYAPQVTAQVEFGKIKKSSGVKGKEFLFWVTLSEIYEDDPPTAKITCKNPIGISRSYPPSAL